MILIHDVENIHQLPLVGMNTLHLNIKDGIRVKFDKIMFQNILCQSFLAQMFDFAQLREERLVVYIVVQKVQLFRIAVPAAAAQRLIDEAGQFRIRAHQPAAMRDAVGLVVEHLRIVFVEIMQRRCLQNIGMNLGHAVDAVTADNGQACHMHHAIFEDGHGLYLGIVVRIAVAHIFEMTAVDFLDNHVDARQKFLEHIHRPGFECLRHDGMVGVGDGILGDSPSFAPFQTVFINQDAHEFRNGYSRMRIVDMDGNLLAQVANLHARLDVVTYNALHAGRRHEVFLNQAHLAAFPGAVIRIEVTGNTLDEQAVFVLLPNLLLREIAIIGEVTVNFCIPKAQIVDRVVMIADNGHIIGNCHDDHGVLMHELQAAVRHLLHISIAVELDIHGLIRLAVFPGKAVLQPVVGDFYLVAVNDFLLKQTVLITDGAAMARQMMCCHGIDKAGSKTAQTAVAQTSIGFFFVNLVQVQLEVAQRFLNRFLNAQINQIGFQETAHQELNGEIVNLLFLTLHIGLVGLNPIFRNIHLRHSGYGLIDFVFRQFVQLTAPHEMCSIDEPGFQIFLNFFKLGIVNIRFLLCQKKHSLFSASTQQ